MSIICVNGVAATLLVFKFYSLLLKLPAVRKLNVVETT